MRRLIPFVFIIFITLPAALPYLSGDIPRTNDSLAHFYRAVELDHLVRSGNIFPRWAPDLALGYGYPIFNYFAYGSHYLIVLFHFTGISLLWSLRAAYIFALVMSGVGAYMLGRDLFGEQAGAMTAIAYTYSPYLLYTAHIRGGLPESLALAFLPFALWSVRRALIHEGTLRKNLHILLASIFISLIIFSHIGMTLQQLPLIGVWGCYVIVDQVLKIKEIRSHGRADWDWKIIIQNLIPKVGILSGIFLLALALTSFAWIPSVTELSFVQFDSAFGAANLSYQTQFFYWRELFALPNFPVYTDLVNPPLVRSLPLLASMIACVAVMRSRSLQPILRTVFYFSLFLSLITSFLIVDSSKIIWDFIPLLQRSAFPWRFLGPASLFIALTASAITLTLRRPIYPILIVSLLFASSLPLLYPPRESTLDNPSLSDLARYEIPPLLVGTTTTGEYTPQWVKEFPDTKKNQAMLISGEEIQRLEIKNWKVERLAAQPTREVYRLAGAASVTAVYRAFYFPGWQATLDGKSIDLKPTQPNGLITFDIPAGEHTLEIYFGDTLLRQIANSISIVALLLLIGSWLSGVRDWKLEIGNGRLEIDNWKLLIPIYLLLFIVPFAIIKRGAPPMPHPLEVDVASELILHGYDLKYDAPNKGTLTLLWQAQHELGVNYGVTIRIVDDRGLQWQDESAPEEARNWRFRPGTDSWKPDQFFYDSYVLKTISGAPPNKYDVVVVVYRADTRQEIGKYRIGDFVIEQPNNEPLKTPLMIVNGMRLIDAKADRGEVGVGMPYRLDVKWQAGDEKIVDERLKLELINEKGVMVYAREEAISPSYAPSKWKRGDVILQSLFLRMPASLESGDYHWRVNGVYDVPLKIRVAALQRVFVEPKMMFPQRQDVGEAVMLLGYDERQEADRRMITLVWKARQEMSQSYRVFLHALDVDGNLVAQSDGEPVDWARPTTGWMKDEVIVETRWLNLKAGEYTLVVGLVDEAGERIGAFSLMK